MGMDLKMRLELDQHLGRVYLSPDPFNSCPFLIYSNSLESGQLGIFDLEQLAERQVIPAHTSPIHKLCTNFEGNLAATYST